MTSKGETRQAAGRCPICGARTEQAYRPFCSARCRDIDLARWLGDGYAIAGGEAAGDEDGEEGGAGGGTGSPSNENEDGD